MRDLVIELVGGSKAIATRLPPSYQPSALVFGNGFSSEILATIITYNVAMMCDPETIVTWATIGVLTGLRQKTLMSEVLLLAGL